MTTLKEIMSPKSIAIVGASDTKTRIGGTVASSIYLMMQGVQILRIHDVNELLQGAKVFKRLIRN